MTPGAGAQSQVGSYAGESMVGREHEELRKSVREAFAASSVGR